MAILPVPASVYFNDFAFDLIEYNIQNGNTTIGAYKGLPNSNENGNYVGFLMSDNPKLSIGDIIVSTDKSENYQIKNIDIDTYNGKSELLKAYY